MKTIIFSAIFLLSIVHVRADLKANMEYFVLTEAHISEYRSYENANAGYSPLYITCDTPVLKHSCQPAVPKINDTEGYINIEKSHRSQEVHYGCPENKIPKNVFNPEEHIQKELLMKPAEETVYTLGPKNNFTGIREYNQYKYQCVSEVLPALWRMGPIQGDKVTYGIGFLIRGLKDMPIVEVYYNQQKKIPIWTKHTLHGASLAVPIAAFKSIEEIVYQEDLENFSDVDLKAALESIYEFNENNNVIKRAVNKALGAQAMGKTPEETKIVMGHMIPEYDMITSNWQKVTRFAQTIVPTWEDLYLNEWIDVEEMIREVSFMNEKKLTVFSGTHGQLTFNMLKNVPFERRFFLGNKALAVPEMIWKLVIDENSDDKKATVIIFHNLSQQLDDLKLFTKFIPPCGTICSQFQQKSNDSRNKQIYCCTVDEVQEKIEELPTEYRNKKFDILIN